MMTLLQDVSHAFRSLRKDIGFTIVAVVTLALGLGATTVIYSIVDHVVLRPLSYPGVDRLVVARLVVKEMVNAYPTLPVGAKHFDAWRRDCTLCAGMAALTPRDVTLSGVGDAERIGAVRASASLFSLLGVRPELGRFFSTAEDAPGTKVVVISDALWRSRFGADPTLLGRTIMLDGSPHLVIGVTPAAFALPRGNELGDIVKLPPRTDAFVPLGLTPHELASPGAFDYAVLVKPKPDVTIAQLTAQLDAVERGIAASGPEKFTISVALKPLQEQVVGSSARGLLLLLVAVGAMLLLVCLNISILLLARNTNRLRESAIRTALGARRSRLVRSALTESVILSLTGGILGVALSYWGLRALIAIAPSDLPRLNDVHLDAGILAFAFLASTIAGITFGAIPAIRYGAADPAELMKAGGRTNTESRGAHRSRSVLVTVQVAVSTLLLITTGLFIASFARVMNVHKGFDPANVLAMDVVLPRSDSTQAQRLQFYQSAMDRLRSLPGVRSTAVTDALPLTGELQVNSVSVEHDQLPEAERPLANLRSVSPDYFMTLGTPIRDGRAFNLSDKGSSVAVVSERVASTLWPGENPIGKRLISGDNAALAEVVGVAADVPTTSLEHAGSLVIYFPYWNLAPFAGSILIRTTTNPSTVISASRAAIRDVDPTVPVAKVRTMAQVVSSTVAERRFEVVLLVVFALTALATGCVGLYGTTAYSVGLRMNEIGIRMVLGAGSNSIYRLVLRKALTPVALGLFIGLMLSFVSGRLFSSMLFEVGPSDPRILISVMLLLGGATTIASFLPSRRAVMADPIASLRMD